VITCFLANWGFAVAFGLLFSLSEYIGQNQNIKANSVYQFVRNVLMIIAKK
jgi:hypothetical protein